MLQRKGIQNNGLYNLDPYLGPRGGPSEELNKLRQDVASLKAENSSLKSRLQGDHQVLKPYGHDHNNYRRGSRGRGGRSGRGEAPRVSRE